MVKAIKKGISPEIIENIRFQYEKRRQSVYSLAKEDGVSESTIHRYRREEHWEQEPYVSQIQKWKDIEDQTKSIIGESVVILAEKVKSSSEQVDPGDYIEILRIARTLQNLASIVGVKSSLDLKMQEERLDILRMKTKENDTEPLLIKMDVPSEWCK